MDNLSEATPAQKYFLMLMAADDINYRNTIDMKLSGIAKGVGIEFKGQIDRQSTSFREEMKQKQKERKRSVN